jgi:hypothetical protein
MGTLEVVGGDYQRRRGSYDGDGLKLRTADGKAIAVPFASLRKISVIVN